MKIKRLTSGAGSLREGNPRATNVRPAGGTGAGAWVERVRDATKDEAMNTELDKAEAAAAGEAETPEGLARTVAPEDLAAGQYVCVLHTIGEHLTCGMLEEA